MRAVAAILYAVAMAVLAAIASAFFQRGLTTTTAALSLGIGTIVGLLAFWKTERAAHAARPFGLWDWVATVVFALFSLRAFLWLIFRDGDSIKVLSPNNLGDLSLHLTYIEHLASGVPFWPENPIFSGGALTYPLGVDLFNSVLRLLGVDLVRGLIAVGLGGCACLGFTLWRWGGAFAVFGFLCNGGLFGFEFFNTGQLVDYQSDMAWKSLPLALLVTQRGLLFALPAGLLLLSSWRSRFFTSPELPHDRLPLLGEILLYGAMPVFHLHTFLFLSLLLAIWFVVYPATRRGLALLVGGAFLPATVLVLLVTGMLRGSSMLGWKVGWMQDSPEFLRYVEGHFGALPALVTVPLFWILNFGALPFLVAWLAMRLARSGSDTRSAVFVFPALGIFALCTIVKFAPWEWDNTKIMIWAYLAILPFLWTGLIQKWVLPVRSLMCCVLFFSGFVSLLGGLNAAHSGYPIASRSDLDGVRSAVAGIPVGPRFIGFPTYNHPLLLVGRPMALGYPGHAWSHGLQWQTHAARVEIVMNGGTGWREAATALDVRYLFWGSEERENYSDSAQPWKATTLLVASGDWGELYDLATPASPNVGDSKLEVAPLEIP